MENDKKFTHPGLIPSGLPVDSFNESDIDPVVVANLSGSFHNSSHIAKQEVDGDVQNISCLSQKSSTNLSIDFRKFNSRLSSHMSTFSDTLFSDIEDIEDIVEPQTSNQDVQTESIPLPQENNALKEILKQNAHLNEGAIYMPSTLSSFLPRTHTPQPTGVTSLQGIPEEVTPTKPIQSVIDPLTPTANLKVLISAASPEIRNRERQKLNETGEFEMINTSFINSCDNTSDIIVDDNMEYISSIDSNESLFASSKHQPDELVFGRQGRASSKRPVQCNIEDKRVDWEVDNRTEPAASVSRKEKSLGLLCQRFLAMYPDRPEPTERHSICLDGVALHLGVERRRIYDIINVLESVDMVSRVGKNKYEWHGKSALHTMLGNLKVRAENEGFRKRLSEMREVDALPCDTLRKSSTTENRSNGTQQLGREMHRKDKSLGLLCQKFLMLFLVSEEPRVINLDLSAKILIGDPDVDKTETGKYKTKIRRLYDIANILTSLELICKIHVTEVRGRKPAFQYTGPDPDTLGQVPPQGSSAVQYLEPSSNLPAKKEFIVVQPGNLPSKKPVLPQQLATKKVIPTSGSRKAGKASKEKAVGARKSLTRHASFEQICQVAEQEFERVHHQNPTEASKITLNSQGKNSHERIRPESKIVLASSQAVAPGRNNKLEPQTTVLNLTEDQLQGIIKMLSNRPEDSQVRLETGGSTRSPTLSSKDLLTALKKASNKHANTVVGTSNEDPVMPIHDLKSPAVNHSSSDSGYLSFTSGDSSSKKSRDTQSKLTLKRESISSGSPSYAGVKKPKLETVEMDSYHTEDEEVENEKPLDLSRYNILHEPLLAQGPDLEVANITKESQIPNKMPKMSPLKSLNIGDSFPSNVPLVKMPSFGLPKLPSLDSGLVSPLMMDKNNRPGSQLNTPTFPVVNSTPQETGGGSTSVFQFPTPGFSKITDTNTIKSLPTTPTYRLSCTNSPVMLIPPSRPASFGGVAAYSVGGEESTGEHLPVTQATALAVLRNNPHHHPVSVQKFSNILMTPTSEHITAYKISPFTSTPTTPFLLPGSANKVLNHITPVHLRPTSGIRPSMNKMVNLVSVFAPHSDLVEQVPVNFFGNTVEGNNTIVSATGEIVGNYLDINCTTPVGPHVCQLGGGVTPGTFFTHTPGPELYSPVNPHDSSMEVSATSAFQSLKVAGKGNRYFVPPRKLSLPGENQ